LCHFPRSRRDCAAAGAEQRICTHPYGITEKGGDMRLVSRIMSLASFVLVIIGALNWLLVGVARFDLVRWLFGRKSPWGRVVYSLVGTAGVNELAMYLVRMLRTRSVPVVP